MSLKAVFNALIVIVVTIKSIKSEESCEAIIPDALTEIQNGSIVVFQKNEVWFMNKELKELVGPCPISEVFKGMEGPIDAAVTIGGHASVTEFIGASIYFENGKFYTFRNLRPYQVEWGNLIYLPVKGEQSKMGATADSKKYMSQTMSAAYFDPISTRSKFVFSDGTVLGYNFELGSEYDEPEVSDLNKEFKNYGITQLPTITAALDLNPKQKRQLFLFNNNSSYCLILLKTKKKSQTCDLKPVSEFFDCKTYVRKRGNCVQSVRKPVVIKFQALDANSSDETTIQSVNQTQSVSQTAQTNSPSIVASITTGFPVATTGSPVATTKAAHAINNTNSLPTDCFLYRLILNLLFFLFIKIYL